MSKKLLSREDIIQWIQRYFGQGPERKCDTLVAKCHDVMDELKAALFDPDEIVDLAQARLSKAKLPAIRALMHTEFDEANTLVPSL